MIYQRDSGIWWVRWKRDRKVHYHNTRTTNKREAETIERDVRAKFERERQRRREAAERFQCDLQDVVTCPECQEPYWKNHGSTAADRRELCSEECVRRWTKRLNPTPTLGAFLTGGFQEFVEASRERIREQTRRGYLFGIRLLSADEIGHVRLDALTSDQVQAFANRQRARKTRRDKQYEIGSVNQALRALKHALNKAREWGVANPACRVSQLPGENHRDRVLTHEEFEKYLAACSEPWRTAALIMGTLALRLEETLRLRWENLLLDPQHGRLQITEGKTKAARRELPLAIVPGVLAALVELHRRQEAPKRGWVFPSRKSQSGHIAYRKDDHDRACREAKVTRFTTHTFRPTCLTNLGNAGCDVFTLARIAGHSSPAILSRYCHSSRDAVVSAFERLQLSA